MNLSSLSFGKSLPVSSANYSFSNQSGAVTSSFDSSRRPTHIQAGSSTSNSIPRKAQTSRKQQKTQRRPAMGVTSPDEYDAMAELRAVRNPHSRRGQTSITHLLNYSAPQPHQEHTSYARSYRRNPTWGPGSGYHASDKARYVLANYRFIVSPEATYPQHAADADLHLDWSNVMQVIASSQSQVTSCPICLSDPVAPRMAKCGHIFCLSCLIRFMNSTSDEDESKSARGPRWKKCPICEDSIYLHEVRPVRFYAGQESPLPRVGDDVILRLMARNTNSTLALPREGGVEVLNSGFEIPLHFAANVLDYARIMMGTGEYMTEQFDEEITALQHQEREDELLFGQDGEWTQRAIKAVNTAKERISTIGEVAMANPTLATNHPQQAPEADFYFYSAPPHLYLSPLDIRILKTKYGSFSSFPSTLLPRVEHISTGHVVDDAMRKRAKYLGHLPRGCVISFLECDWTDIVPPETLESFKSEIERRRKRNRDKAIQEDRERLQAERLEALELRSVTGSRRLPSSLYEEPVPSLDPSEFQPLGSPSDATPPDARPGLDSLSSMSTSPSTRKTIWGTRAAAPLSPDIAAPQPTSVDDGWLKDEELLSPSDLAIQIAVLNAFDNSAGNDDAPNGGPSSAGGGGGGKKKKKQKITLMSTGGRRGN